MLKKIFLTIIFLSFLAFLLYGFRLYRQINRDISYRIKKGLFEEAVASESPVYYDDGKSLIGVFFKKTHRKYLHYNEIPKVFIKALIATEDERFFEHHGFDPRAILRAFIVNLKAGRVVQGGSTITQQLAKNIFGRQKRTYGAKIRELLQAMLLEKRFSKEKILEMYCNQFFVTGYGKGLQIAARYFFDKDAKDLTLVEAAFIAGSLHAPNRYNPFIKKTLSEKKKAMRLAKLRKDYVLKRMLEMHFITKEQYLEAKKEQVPFKKGRITYALNVIMDYVKEQLESDFMRHILKEQGIANIATSGIKIYTSINKDIQRSALLALRKRLPLLDVKLNGYRPEKDEDIERIKKGFTGPFPTIASVQEVDIKNILVKISYKKGTGIIDYRGLRNIGNAWVKWKIGKRARFDKKNAQLFLKNIHKGDKIAVWPTGEGKRFVLTKIPRLEGAIIVLHNGMIKAMVGGYYNVFFNRAIDARRQLGSIFKPFLFTAALKLKWNVLDELCDIQDIYEFEGTYYLPKPDHLPPSESVSIAWTGVKSENLASVWLLYHLMDRLNMDQFGKVVKLLGLSRKKGETYDEYAERIRDRYGILITKKALMEAAFLMAKKEVEPDIIFAGHEEILGILPRLHYEIDEDVIDNLIKAGEKGEEDEEKKKEEERQKQEFMRFSCKRLWELNERMKQKYRDVEYALSIYKENASEENRDMLNEALQGFYLSGQKIIYSEAENDLYPVSPEWLAQQKSLFAMKNVWIEGVITSGILDLIHSYTQKEYERLSSERAYSPDVLYHVPDFRTLVSLYYVIDLTKKMGVCTHLDPVLSFPLGPNSIRIIEAALAYQTIVTGKLYALGNRPSPSMVPIITKILDRNGRLIWRYRPKGKQILSKRISASVSEILRNVIRFGTGRRARGAVKIRMKENKGEIKVPVPCFGKTGTANRFTNSSFIGIVPGINKRKRGLDIEKGYVIATYVGYDDNSPMKSENISIYGASGALPLWIATANAIVNNNSYKNGIQLADLIFTSPKEIIFPEGNDFIYVTVSPITGLPLSSQSMKLPRILTNARKKDGKITFLRYFEP